MSKREILLLIANATDTMARVTVEVHKDHLLILQCPPALIGMIMEAYEEATWKVSVGNGGLRIDVTR